MADAEGLQVDIDLRLADLYAQLWEPGNTEGAHQLQEALKDEGLRQVLSAFLRQAYGLGYRDALREDREGRRAELARTHGYRAE